MRRMIFVASIALGVGASASAAEQDRARSAAPAIVIGAQSNVCVSVHVDQSIWPRPLSADSARSLSGHLTTALWRLYLQRGGSGSLPGTRNEARFVADANGTNPYCRNRDTDVFVDLRYRPRPDGTPFVMEYRIGRGTLVRTDTIERNIAEEVRTGRIPGFHTRRTVATIIVEDIRGRAPMIVDQMLAENR